MILISAPYSPVGTSHPHLGAARKLETVVEALHAIDNKIVFINSAHNELVNANGSVCVAKIGAISVTLITLPTRGNRFFGKILNIFHTKWCLDLVLSIGVPRFVWCYNAYAFESKFAKKIIQRTGCKYFIEFEDWIFSRSRGFNIKPFVDYFYWRRVVGYTSTAFCINASLAKIVDKFQIPCVELPGLISNEISVIGSFGRPPFSSVPDGWSCTVGYFGGLSEEKGADVLLDLIDRLYAIGVRVIVCGSGPLLSDFKDKSAISRNLFVYSNLSYRELLSLIEDSDIVLNPHKTGDGMLNGLFPSKVLEAVGSGRVVISTPLPVISDVDVLSSILLYDGSRESLFLTINSCLGRYSELSSAASISALLAKKYFGIDAFKVSIVKALGDFSDVSHPG